MSTTNQREGKRPGVRGFLHGQPGGVLRRLKTETRGQGTVEYAILVGVLVVIAIIAVIAFKDNLQQLWESISEGINSL